MAWIGVKNLLGPGWFKVCRAGIKISLGFVLGFGVLGRALLEFAVCGHWTESSFWWFEADNKENGVCFLISSKKT